MGSYGGSAQPAARSLMRVKQGAIFALILKWGKQVDSQAAAGDAQNATPSMLPPGPYDTLDLSPGMPLERNTYSLALE